MRTLLKNGTLIDYKTNTFEKFDILIQADKIEKIAAENDTSWNNVVISMIESCLAENE